MSTRGIDRASAPRAAANVPGARTLGWMWALAASLGVAALVSACGGGGGDGTGGAGAGGGAGGEGAGAPAPPLQESCEKMCDHQTAVECAQLTADQCKQQCVYLEQNVGEACKHEYEVYYGCLAELEYQCTQGTPVPVGQEACVETTYALSECIQKQPCIEYCTQAASLPCGPADEAACVDRCVAETSYASSSSCTSDITSLRTCQGQEGALDCAGDTLVTVGCESQIYDYAWCFSLEENDWCEGYCFAVEQVGCAPGGIEECLLTCQKEKHAGEYSYCESYYEDLLECRTQNGIDCSSGAVSDVGCEDALASYQSCLPP